VTNTIVDGARSVNPSRGSGEDEWHHLAYLGHEAVERTVLTTQMAEQRLLEQPVENDLKARLTPYGSTLEP
jgi:hypothetical protein